MEKQLAEVVDGTEIKETIEQEILYSCENNGANNLCSTKNNATCGMRDTAPTDRYVKLLDFTHFSRHMVFSKSERERQTESKFGSKKAILNGVNVSVVLDLVCATKKKYS